MSQVETASPEQQEISNVEAQAIDVGDVMLGSKIIEEQRQATDRTTFVDRQGNTREAHPLAAEVIVTDDIVDAVSDRFDVLSTTLSEVDEKLKILEGYISNPGQCGRDAFDPLNDAFIERIKAMVKSQRSIIVREKTPAETVETTKNGLFGKKPKFHEVQSTRDVLVDGHTKGLESVSIGTHFTYSSFEKDHTTGRLLTKEECIANEETRLLEAAEEILISDESRPGDYIYSGKRLPLLATRLFEAGIDPDDITLETIQTLVPEIGQILSIVELDRAKIEKYEVISLKLNILQQLLDASPDGQMISAIFYNDSDIAEITQRYKHLQALEIIQTQEGRKVCEGSEAFEQQMHDTIEHFFTDKVLADSLVFHGTPALPRIIAKGSLMPGHKMSKEGVPFSFFTRRGDRVGMGVDGSRGVHWSGLHGKSYNPRNGLENLDGYVSSEERAKGPLAAGKVAVRIGDALAQAPYIEEEDISKNERIIDGHISLSSTVVQLTDAGFAKVEGVLKTQLNSRDVVFVSRPRDHHNDELFNHEFPLADMLFQVREVDKEIALQALMDAGWSSEDIERRVLIIPSEEIGDSPKNDGDLLEMALRNPKYPRSIVAGLRQTKH